MGKRMFHPYRRFGRTRCERVRVLGGLGVVAALVCGCGSHARLTLQQPFAPPSQQRLTLESPWGYFVEEGDRLRALLEFPLPSERDGPPAFFCYVIGPAEPGAWRMMAPGIDPLSVEYQLEGGFFPGVMGAPLELPVKADAEEEADDSADPDEPVAEEPPEAADPEQPDAGHDEANDRADDRPPLEAYRGFLIQSVGRLAGRASFTIGELKLRRGLLGGRYREIEFDLYTEDGARLTGRAVLELMPKRFEKFERDYAADVARLLAIRAPVDKAEPPLGAP
ncbi:MAG: hypothetical protein IPM18_14200 [Phycisphaerales bacterium]|nr:hypothetical protein [Phycisphaerales bacterium]